MRSRFRCAALILSLSIPLAACGAEDGQVEPAGGKGPETTGSPTPAAAPVPESPEDFLGLAEKAMAAEEAWTFSVKGEEKLTLQGQRSAASYRATVRRGTAPRALHSQGVTTSSKGTTTEEEIYLLDGRVHLKKGDAPWKDAPASDPGMRNKVEDPVAAVEEFRAYLRAAHAGDVTLTETEGRVELRVSSGKEKLTSVRDRAWVKKAEREFEPTAEQLRTAGIPVNDAQVTLSGLEEVLVLDATTYRIRSYGFTFGFLVPYGGQDVAFEQKVRQENRGTSDEVIELPADLR